MKERTDAAMRGEFEDKVEAAIDTETEQPGRIWVVDMGNDSELWQEISDLVFFIFLFLHQFLDRHEVPIR